MSQEQQNIELAKKGYGAYSAGGIAKKFGVSLATLEAANRK